MNEPDNFALVPKPPNALEKAEPGAKRILSGMVADTLALAKKEQGTKPNLTVLFGDYEHSSQHECFRVVLRDDYNLKIVCSDSAVELLKLAEQQPFDLIVANLTCVRGGDLFDVLKQLKAHYNKPHILLSSWAGPIWRGRIFSDLLKQAGIDAYLEIPWEIAEMRSAVATCLRLPRNAEEKPGEIGTHPRRTRPLRIVIADDDPEYCGLVEDALRNWLKEATVITIHDGLEAWHELLREEPDFLIMDQNHPGLDGLEMLRRLAERKVKYPILVASGMAKEKDVRQCAGPDLKFTFFPKPFGVKEFLRQVSIILGPGDNSQHVSLNIPHDTTTPGEVTQPHKTRPPRVVILDDEDGPRRSISVLVKSASDGVEILEFSDSRAAWQELSQTDPDLLITDLKHVGISGREMLTRLAERKVKYPIFVVSGSLSFYSASERRSWGPGLNVSFREKPVDVETFRTAVEAALQIPARPAP
jgi:DNA-binding NtrC family response regulator